MEQVHRAHGHFVLMGDHEVGNDWNPETVPKSQLKAALQAFRDHIPLRESDQPDRMWRSYKFGKAAELFLLDTRQERKPSTRKTPNATFLSKEQLEWLKTGLKDSTSVFKFVVTPEPMGDFPWTFHLKADDRWEGYQAQRRELLDYILENKLEGVWFLAGDFHMASSGRVGGAKSPDFKIPEVLVGPGAYIGNLAVSTLKAPQFEFATNSYNFGVFRVDPKKKTLEVSFIDSEGKTLFDRTYDPSGRPLNARAESAEAKSG